MKTNHSNTIRWSGVLLAWLALFMLFPVIDSAIAKDSKQEAIKQGMASDYGHPKGEEKTLMLSDQTSKKYPRKLSKKEYMPTGDEDPVPIHEEPGPQPLAEEPKPD